MYQDNNQQNPIDYLDQIAPAAPKSNWILSKKPILIGLIVMAALLIIISAFSIFSGNTKTTVRLAARLVNTEVLTKDASKNIKSSQLRATNSNLQSYLSNTIRDVEPFLTKDGVKIKSLDKNILASEANTKLNAILEDARLNAVYDRVYTSEMAYRLDTIITLMNQIKKGSSNKQLKEFLVNSIDNLNPIQKQFADFNAANG